jgi:hypothetical protein
MAFPLYLVKQLYRCDSVVNASFVRIENATRSWRKLLAGEAMVLRITAPYKELQTNRQKKPVEATKETSVCETGMGKKGTQLHVG